MSTSQVWVAVLLASALAFALKLLGYLIPTSVVDGPRRSRIVTLLPVALLAGLVVTQSVGGDGGITLDARLAAVALALVLLWRGAPFLLVVIVAAAGAAALRALGWG